MLWTFDFWRCRGEEIVERRGPGHLLGAICARELKGKALLVRAADRVIVVSLREPYDPLAHYDIDYVNQRFEIDER